MQTISGLNSDSTFNTFFAEDLSSKNQKNSLKQWVKDKIHDPLLQYLKPLSLTISNTIKIASSLLFPKGGNSISTHSVFSELKKIAVLELLSVPFTLYNLAMEIKGFVNILFMPNAKHHKAAISAAAMRVLSALGKVANLPIAIVKVIQIFAPLINVAWVPPMAAVSAILSVATIIHSGFTLYEVNKFSDELKSTSQHAFIKKLSESPENASFRAALKEADPTLLRRVDAELGKLAEGNSKTLEKLIYQIQSSIVDPNILGELKKAADLAYLDCVQSKDVKFLKKHFDVEGETIKSALTNIANLNSDRISTLQQNLSERIKDRTNSDKISIIIDAVTTIAAIILVVSSFVLACSPIAPLGFALLIMLGMIGILKLIVEQNKKTDFENNLSFLTRTTLTINNTIKV